MLEALQRAWSIPELRKRITFVLGMLLIFAVGAHIPVPGIDRHIIENYLRGSRGGGLLGLIDVFGGGAMRRMSIFSMGIQPYINSSIIMQMMTIAVPHLDALSKEGESGRKQIARITRNLTVVLAAVQSFGMTYLFSQQGAHISLLQRLEVCVAFTAGSSFLLWLGEQVTQKGVGNGISLIIFAGILLSLRNQCMIIGAQLQAGTPWFNLVVLIAFFVATVLLIVYISQGTRRIPIQHTKRVIGMRQTQAGASFLPIKVNTAGVIPIIFAMSLMALPATIVGAIPSQSVVMQHIKEFFGNFLPGQTVASTAFYGLLVIVFTYFYTAIVMNVQEMADNLKKYGNYIPGIRPGKPTFEYLERVISRITLAGAVFLAIIAVLQYVVPNMTGFQSFTLVGGTSLLIIVGVAIETMQAIEAQLLMRNYEGFIKGGGQGGLIGG
jgi:preprotein translocase subunit SecY